MGGFGSSIVLFAKATNAGLLFVLALISRTISAQSPLPLQVHEFADITSNSYYEWFLNNAYFIYAAQAAMAKFTETFKEFPSVQRPNTFTADDALRKLTESAGGD